MENLKLFLLDKNPLNGKCYESGSIYVGYCMLYRFPLRIPLVPDLIPMVGMLSTIEEGDCIPLTILYPY